MNSPNQSAHSRSKWTLYLLTFAALILYAFLTQFFVVIKDIEKAIIVYQRLSWIICDVAFIILAVIFPFLLIKGLAREGGKYFRISLCILFLLLVTALLKTYVVIYVEDQGVGYM